MADAVNDGSASLNMALAWHLQSNHYPPLPSALIETAKQAIEAGNDDDFDREIDLPDGIELGDRTSVPAGELIEAMHLDAFLISEDPGQYDDDFEEEDPYVEEPQTRAGDPEITDRYPSHWND
jgi:hypothetical protein